MTSVCRAIEASIIILRGKGNRKFNENHAQKSLSGFIYINVQQLIVVGTLA